MKKNNLRSKILALYSIFEIDEKIAIAYLALKNLTKWFLISSIIGVLSGTASAFFLESLSWATNTRNDFSWFIYLLPFAGFIVGWVYHIYGKEVQKGNNLILEQIHKPSKVLEFKMAPFVLIGTVITHLFGGSAGREGTALQMSASISDQLTKYLKLDSYDRKILLISGLAAGFGSVFGTPLAGAFFGLEVYVLGRMRYNAIFPVFVAAAVGDYVCGLWGVGHSHYTVNYVPDLDFQTVFFVILVSISFGLVGRLFSFTQSFCTSLFTKYIKFPPLRLFYGGLVIILLYLIIGTDKFLGLGLPVIKNAFVLPLDSYDFILKLLFTTITLGAGFKGGEVTPLFFIGATLGNALAYFIPLPLSFLVALGFVGVFSGAANTPLACTLMAIELFGMEIGVFAAIACVVSYMFSGHKGIYSSQLVGEKKYGDKLYLRNKKKHSM